MIQIDSPIHRLLAHVVDAIGKTVYETGRLFGLWNIEKMDLRGFRPNNILVIEQEPIGDAIMSTSLLPTMRKAYPDARITVLVGSWAKDVFSNNPNIDEVIVHDCPWAFSDYILSRKSLKGHLQYLLSYPKLRRDLKDRGFDLGLDLRGDFRSILFLICLAGVKRGLSFDRSGGRYLLTQSCAFVKGRHEIDKKFELLDCLGLDQEGQSLSFFPTQNDRNRVDSIMSEAGIRDTESVCVIHPGTRRHLKIWPLVNYAEVADFMWTEYETRVVLTGVSHERHMTTGIIDNMQQKNAAVDLCGALRFVETGALIQRANLVVCPDTSIMHLAAAFSTRTIALFGPGDPSHTGPRHENAAVLYKDFPCSPCGQKKCILKHVGDSPCMTAIKVDEAKAAIRQFMTAQEFA